MKKITVIFVIVDDLTDDITTIEGDYITTKAKIMLLAGSHYVTVYDKDKNYIEAFWVENLG